MINFSKENELNAPKKFSTFEGVFTPTLMTIISVVIYLRANFIIGHAGIYQAIALLCIAKAITTLTGFSISAIATNTDVKGGGAYYLISRSIGPEFGGAIGLTIFLSQALIIPFHLIGFTEAVVLIIPALRPFYAFIAFGSFALTAFMAFKGAAIVLKTQFFVMIVIALSIITMLIGAFINFDEETFKANLMPYNADNIAAGVVPEVFESAQNISLSTQDVQGSTQNISEQPAQENSDDAPNFNPQSFSDDLPHSFEVSPNGYNGYNGLDGSQNIRDDFYHDNANQESQENSQQIIAAQQPTIAAPAAPQPVRTYSFWVLFAIYFPAVTGIMTGLNMSGDLKNPTKSIPRGTLAAILVGFLVYAAQMILCGGAISRENLILNPYDSLTGMIPIVSVLLISAGVLAATLSSALGTVLGAPRVLQSLAQDKILKPVNIFAKVTPQGEPRRALILTLIIGFAVIYFSVASGDGAEALNAVAAVVSMFFLLTYGIINYAAFVESFSRNPSFRPRFKFFHWIFALVGAVASFGATLLINPFAALCAFAIFAGVFFYVRKYVLDASFGDARRGFTYSRARDNLLALTVLPAHAKNWRPTPVVFAGGIDRRQNLIRYADWLSSGRGILTIASMVRGSFSEMVDKRSEIISTFDDFLSKNNIKAFPEVLVTPDFDTGISHFLQAHSIGPIKPNIALFGWSHDPARADAFMGCIRTASSLNMSVGLVYGKDLPESVRGKDRVIDIWWRGMRNGSLMVILAHLMSLNSEWSGARIRMLRAVRDEVEADAARAELVKIADAARMNNLEVDVIHSTDNFPDVLRRVSGDSTVVFMGFTTDEKTDPIQFQESYTKLLNGLPTTILIQSTGDADLLS